MALDVNDRLAIQELINRYCHIADYGPADAMREMFTDDGVFEAPARGHEFRGIDAFLAFLRSRSDAPPVGFHVTSNTVIEGGGNEAKAVSYLQIVSAGESPRTIVMFGRYFDTLVRTPAGWRFRHRRVELG